MDSSDQVVREAPPKWADLCANEFEAGSIEDKEAQEKILNAIVLAEGAVVNLLSVCICAPSGEKKSCLVEEKMFEIAGILGISVEGRIKEI